MKAVMAGEHKSKIKLTAISLVITIGWILLLPTLTTEGTTSLELAALAMYIFTFVGELGEYARAVTEFRTGLIEYDTLEAFLSRRSTVADEAAALELKPTPNPEIEFKNVSFSYGGKHFLVLQLPQNEFLFCRQSHFGRHFV